MTIRLLITLFVFLNTGCGQANETQPVVQEKNRTENIQDLAETIADVSVRFRVPIIAELALPLSKRAMFTTDGQSLVKTLDEIVNQNPSYTWQRDGKVILFVQANLKDSDQNIMNSRFEQFEMPGDVGELEYILKPRLLGIKSNGGKRMEGYVATGFRHLENIPLSRRTLVNVTAREVLLSAANDALAFSSIIIFASEKSAGIKDSKYAFKNWIYFNISKPTPKIFFDPKPE
jgi:hypothetical protein